MEKSTLGRFCNVGLKFGYFSIADLHVILLELWPVVKEERKLTWKERRNQTPTLPLYNGWSKPSNYIPILSKCCASTDCYRLTSAELASTLAVGREQREKGFSQGLQLDCLLLFHKLSGVEILTTSSGWAVCLAILKAFMGSFLCGI